MLECWPSIGTPSRSSSVSFTSTVVYLSDGHTVAKLIVPGPTLRNMRSGDNMLYSLLHLLACVKRWLLNQYLPTDPEIHGTLFPGRKTHSTGLGASHIGRLMAQVEAQLSALWLPIYHICKISIGVSAEDRRMDSDG